MKLNSKYAILLPKIALFLVCAHGLVFLAVDSGP